MAKSAKRSVNIYVNADQAKMEITELKKAALEQARAFDRMQKGTSEYYMAARKLSALNEEIKRHNELTKAASERSSELKKKWMDMGAGLGGFVQVISTIKSAVNSVRDLAAETAKLDDAMGLVRKTTNLSKDDVQGLNKEFRKMDTRTSREELNDLAYAAGKLGISAKEDVLEFVKAADVINIALGDVLGGTESIIEVTKLAEMFKKGTKEIQEAGMEETLIRTGSVINELGKTSTANEKAISKFLSRIASYASISGVTLDQAAGLGAVLSQQNKAPEMGATAVTKIWQQMIKKSDSFAKMIGISTEEMSEMMSKDFNAAFLKVLERFREIGDIQKIVPLFKELGSDATRASQVVLALADNIDKVREAQATANIALKEGTSMNKEYTVMNETQQAQMEKARKRVEDSRIVLGEQIYPDIIKLIGLKGRIIKGTAEIAEYLGGLKQLLVVGILGAVNAIKNRWEGIVNAVKGSKFVTSINEYNSAKTAYPQEMKKMLEMEDALKKKTDLRNASIEKTKTIRWQINELQERGMELEAAQERFDTAREKRVLLEKEMQRLGNEELKYRVAGEKLGMSEHELEISKKQVKIDQLAVEKQLETARTKEAFAATKLETQKQRVLKVENEIDYVLNSQMTDEEKLAKITEITTGLEKDKTRELKKQKTLKGEIADEKEIVEVQRAHTKELENQSKIGTILKANWMLILTVVVELAIVIYNIVKKQRELKNLQQETTRNIEKERLEADQLFRALKDVNTTEEERARIMGVLNSKYGEYLSNLKDEKGQLIDLEAAHRRVTAAIIEQANAKGFQEALEKLGDKYSRKINNIKGNIRRFIGWGFMAGKEGNAFTDMMAGRLIEYVKEGMDEKDIQKTMYEEFKKQFPNASNKQTKDFSSAIIQSINQAKYLKKKEEELEKETDKQRKFYNQLAKEQNKRIEELIEDYKTWDKALKRKKETGEGTKNEEENIEKIKAQAKAAFSESLLPEGWKKMTQKELEDIYKEIEKKSKEIKPNTTLWGSMTAGADQAKKLVKDQIELVKKNGGKPLPEDAEDMDPTPTTPTDKTKGKTPAEQWEDILEDIKKVFDKYDLKETPISEAKRSLLKDMLELEQKIDEFVAANSAYTAKAEEQRILIREEKAKQMERIDEEEAKKRREAIEKSLKDTEDKLAKYALRQHRKTQAQLLTDIEEITLDWEKAMKKRREQYQDLETRRTAGRAVSNYLNGIKPTDADVEAMQKLGITLKMIDVKKALWGGNKNSVLRTLGLYFSDEDQKILDSLQQWMEKAEKSKIEEITALALERTKEIARTLSSSATREYLEATEAMAKEIETVEAAISVLKEQNTGGLNDEEIKKMQDLLDKLLKRKQKLDRDYNSLFGDTSWQTIFGISEENWEDWEHNWANNLERMADTLQQFADKVFQLWDQIDNYMSKRGEAEMEKTQQEYDAKSEALKRQLDSGLISQKKHDAQMERLEKEKDRKERKIKHDQFEREKTADIIQAVVNGALSITAVWATHAMNPVLAGMLTALTAAINAVQVATIAAQPNPYAKGSYIRGPQIALMGEEGDEWVASNKLLRDKETAPIIESLDKYQKGDRTAIAKLRMDAPDTVNVSQAMRGRGGNFAPSNQSTVTNIYQNTEETEILKELKELKRYMKDPRNRQAVISRSIQLEFERQEEAVRAAARL